MNKGKLKKRNPILGLFLLLIICLMIGGAVIATWWSINNSPVDTNDETEIKVIIPKGYGATDIADLLTEKDLIKSSLIFRIVVKTNDLGGQLQAGSYRLSRSQTPKEIAESLTSGSEEEFWITIPEGKRREEVAKILNDGFAEHGSSFSLPDFIELTKDMEGYLFPDTYLFPKTTTTEEAVSIIRNTFDIKIPDEMKIRANNLGLEFQEALILASLVEREAKYEIDRPMIARVMLNRLNIGMPLQIDATVQYAVGQAECSNMIGKDCKWWPQLTSTTFKSVYNTYQNPGLPPTPICNPGLAVFEALFNAEDHDYLYYLSEDSGKTYYSKTLEEHEAKIDKYLR